MEVQGLKLRNGQTLPGSSKDLVETEVKLKGKITLQTVMGDFAGVNQEDTDEMFKNYEIELLKGEFVVGFRGNKGVIGGISHP